MVELIYYFIFTIHNFFKTMLKTTNLFVLLILCSCIISTRALAGRTSAVASVAATVQSSTTATTNLPLDSLFDVLDEQLDLVEHYDRVKSEHIQFIKEQFKANALDAVKLYEVNNQLYEEYQSFKYDSARHYIEQNLAYSIQVNQPNKIVECLLKKSHILLISGLYEEAHDVLRKIHPQTLSLPQKIEYYNNYENLYLYKAEYTTGEDYMRLYIQKAYTYRDTILTLATPGSYEYLIIKAPQLIEHQHINQAIQLLLQYLPNYKSGTRDYSVLTSIMAFAYEMNHDLEHRKLYLLLSAISDVKACNKETNSIRVLAEILLQENNIEKAYRYLNVSIQEANFFHARLRNLQAQQFLPIIMQRNEMEHRLHQQRLTILLSTISLVALIVLALLLYSYMITKSLRITRKEIMHKNNALEQSNLNLQQSYEQQQQTNALLAESNTIKEEYIGRFLNLCSNYIDSNNEYRKKLNKLAVNHKLEELFENLKSTERTVQELAQFYQNFDTAFLNIFPQFVTLFNQLLPSSEQIIPKKSGTLTTDLRVFALIRLGINDSHKIADILHSSITTIYTYRSKMKNKSLYKDNFEQKIMEIN